MYMANIYVFTYKMYLLFLLYLLQHARSYNCYYPRQILVFESTHVYMYAKSCYTATNAILHLYKCILKIRSVAANDQTKHKLI